MRQLFFSRTDEHSLKAMERYFMHLGNWFIECKNTRNWVVSLTLNEDKVVLTNNPLKAMCFTNRITAMTFAVENRLCEFDGYTITDHIFDSPKEVVHHKNL